ncbi:TPA: hypothetical protein N0F65_003315, partial [Lagenidium giganteum]
VQAIDYESIRQKLDRGLSSDIPLDRACQIEFYKAAYRCTPSTFVTSVDRLLGIELLREASNLTEHIERLAPGGHYSSLDFRRVASIDDVAMKRIATDMLRCEALFVVCYDARIAGVVALNSAMYVVYRIQLSSK